MKPLHKVIAAFVVIAVVGSVYYSFIKPTDELGDFGKFNVGNEINQRINVGIVHDRGLVRDEGGNITGFVGVDRNNTEMRIALHNPTTLQLTGATIVELLGHLHRDNFVAAEISIVK
jgi:hypothetical protein